MAKIGWAYDLKTVSPEMVMKRVKRTGDGSYVPPKQYGKLFHTISEHSQHEDGGDVWGWDDKDMKPEDRETALIIGQNAEEKTD